MLARLRYLLALALVAACAVLGSTAPADAHGDEGTMEVVTAEQEGTASIRVVVGLVYENDDDLATDATVTATVTGPDGTALPPTPLPIVEGSKYGATIAVSSTGTWTVRVTSTSPTAEATTTVDVVAATSTTGRLPDPSTTTAGGSATDGSENPSVDAADPADPDATPADDDGGTGMQLAIALAAASAVVVLAFLIVARRRTPPEV